MNKKPECVELQSRLVEYFSDPPKKVPEEILEHLSHCPRCQEEFEQTRLTLLSLREEANEILVLPDHLLTRIETRLDQTPQAHRPVRKSTKQRNILILQYAYLSTMAIFIWLSLMLIQPIFNDWLLANELSVNLPLIAEYGLFILFFAAGGVFAAISSPLIIRNSKANLPTGEKTGIFRRLFSGLRLFAC